MSNNVNQENDAENTKKTNDRLFTMVDWFDIKCEILKIRAEMLDSWIRKH